MRFPVCLMIPRASRPETSSDLSRHSAVADQHGWVIQEFHARLGAARVNVMSSYPDPLFVSNETGRPSSRFGALSQIVSVSPSRT
jgi:hypothetical protein